MMPSILKPCRAPSWALNGVIALGCFGATLACSSSDSGPTDTGTGQTGPCGNGQLEPGELCDPGIASGPGACPGTCSDGVACTTDLLSGSAETCDAVCTHEVVGACTDGDNCCPSFCDASLDSDCSPTCGDGVVDPQETCDGNCPTSCDDGNACTRDRILGGASTCSLTCAFVDRSECADGDGCCPAGCDQSTDDDCSPTCGDGVLDAGETCDGDCAVTCDDQDACTLDRSTGAAATCSLECVNQPLSECIDGDGCCPVGCGFPVDDDCENLCGNGEVDVGESCDGDCPNDCPGSVPTCVSELRLTGSPGQCNVRCVEIEITQCMDGDGCCPEGCDNTNDNNCQALSSVGGSCEDDDDCADDLSCVRSVGTTSYVGGYCTRACSEESACPTGSGCAFNEVEGRQCYLACNGDEDCRNGYRCRQIFGQGPIVCAPEIQPGMGGGG